MENWKTHLFSSLTLIVFLILALASSPDGGIVYKCDDSSLKVSEPLTPSGQSSATYQLRVLDKETNMPIPSISLVAIWRRYQCSQLSNCPEKCFMDLGLSTIHEGVTNSNGTYNNTTPSWFAYDAKDRMIGEIHVIDESNQYVPRRITVRVNKDETSASFTIYLLKISSL